jgi:Acyl-CoA dehydrogenase, C-terminal domain
VITELSNEAAEYGRVAREAFAAAGGEQLAPLAGADPRRAGAIVASVLTDLGAWDLDARTGADDAEAAAALCRSAGYWALAHPVAERLTRPTDVDADGLLVVGPVTPSARVAGLDLRWVAVDLEGRRSVATPRSERAQGRPDASVVALDLEPLDDGATADAALGLVLSSWTLLGMLDRAVDVTRTHILGREQFGQPLASFQGVQFQLTDAEVERLGFEELAKYSLWSVATIRPEALDDALALRVGAVEAAEIVLRVAHQLHGAIGFCDETPLSWVSRASVPLRRYPLGLSATRSELTRRISHRGLTGLFSTPAD